MKAATPDDAKDVTQWGIVKWLEHGMLNIVLDAPDMVTEDLIARLLQFPRLLRLNSTQIGSIALDDTTLDSRKLLTAASTEIVGTNQKKIMQFFGKLKLSA